jgi:hypothetical protein
MKEKVKAFIAEVNKHFAPVGEIVYSPSEEKRTDIERFELQVVACKCFNGGYLNKTDEYKKLLDKVGMEYFKCKPNFNNTGNIFWFYPEVKE